MPARKPGRRKLGFNQFDPENHPLPEIPLNSAITGTPRQLATRLRLEGFGLRFWLQRFEGVNMRKGLIFSGGGAFWHIDDISGGPGLDDIQVTLTRVEWGL